MRVWAWLCRVGRWLFGGGTTARTPAPMCESRSSLKGEKLTESETKQFAALKCPDCGEAQLMKGPEGGLCINVYCDNETCGSRFNVMGVFGIERISSARPLKREPLPVRAYR